VPLVRIRARLSSRAERTSKRRALECARELGFGRRGGTEPPNPSREAATECSPRRKWVEVGRAPAPKGRKRRSHAHSLAPARPCCRFAGKNPRPAFDRAAARKALSRKAFHPVLHFSARSCTCGRRLHAPLRPIPSCTRSLQSIREITYSSS